MTIPSWLEGLESRLRACGVRAPRKLGHIVRRDFSAAAARFIADPAVSPAARKAFARHFLARTSPEEARSPSPLPPVETMACIGADQGDGLDGDSEDAGPFPATEGETCRSRRRSPRSTR